MYGDPPTQPAAGALIEPMATVAIVGRPNVGKSTLFNRLAGKKLAIVHDEPGVTRDRREAIVRLGDLTLRIVDTAGLEEAAAGTLAARMRAQTDIAIADSDLMLFMIDARTGVTPLDAAFANLLRRAGKPVLLIANKAEGRQGQTGALEAYALGLGEPSAISAEHGEGIGALYSILREKLHAHGTLTAASVAAGKSDREIAGAPPDVRRPIKLAVVGRPNAGKSTLLNWLTDCDRLLTGPEAGITRDAIAMDWTWKDRRFQLFDTAGLRRKARIDRRLEKLAVSDALAAIRFADVVVVALDATVPFEKQDLQIIDFVVREGRALVVALTKWDLVDRRESETLWRRLQEDAVFAVPQVRGVEMVRVSAHADRGREALMGAVSRAVDTWNRRISTGQLNRWLSEVVERHPPPAVAGRRLKLRYITQPKSRPPYFVIFCSRPEALPESYTRYLINNLRAAFDLGGTPIRISYRKPNNPYAPE